MAEVDLGFDEAFGLKDAEAEAAANPQPEPEQPKAQEPKETPQDEPASRPETGQESDQPREDKGHTVPLNVLLEQREKRQAAERLAEERQRELENLRRQYEAQRQPQQQAKAPDPYEDPEGYNAYVQSQIADREWQMRTSMSERFAEQKYGREALGEAIQWAEGQARSDPFFGQRLRAQASPAEWVVEQHKRDKILSQMGDDPDAWARQRAAELGTVADQQGGVTPPIPQQPAPPRSLASAPATGGHQHAPNGSAFGSVKFGLD